MFQLPKAFPDEVLLSRLIRFVTISGVSSTTLLESSFSSKKTSIHPFLTSGLSRIAELCNEDVNVLLKEQTLAPLFCFYLPVHADYLQKMMLTNNGAKAFRASQLASFGSGQSLGLKSCPLCVQEDLSNYGVSYWHRSHQVPGVATCGYHGTVLSFLELTQRQRIIRQLLPQLETKIQYSPPVEYMVAAFSTQLLGLLTAENPVHKVTDAYRYYLNEKGYLTQSGRVRRQSLMHDFYKYISKHSSTNAALIPRKQDDFRYLSQLLDEDGSHHPYRHLLFGTWLFNSAKQVFAYLPKPILSNENTEPDNKYNQQAVEQECLALLKTGKSLAQIGRETGKSRCYLKRIALLNDISINLKPKLLTQKVINAICSLAYYGFHRREIAKRCGVGIGAVEQIISSRPGLVERRKQCRFESARRKNRVLLLRYLALHPESIRKDVKRDCNSAFFWLYLNDRAWLEEALPDKLHPSGRYSN
ncbi:TnsD family Tn7-like transposition protein [Alteromonas sp. a30]|uniref:TnsD family Tn7-like transposition protein n=1 Tax=Alteromonas sp. a30 TaxID=2730917 RepID=UPI002282077C|nr:TnsD family Tn7-like transposition protein [Alteromonas sp. a30]MCY7296240.1 hypothetical protein [Alteromonas sp. a30]